MEKKGAENKLNATPEKFPENGIMKQLASTLKQWCKTSYQRNLQKQAQMQAENQAQRLESMSLEIQHELAHVLHHSQYPRLVAVNTSMDLRIDGYSVKNGIVIFYYTIDKTVWEKISVTITDIMCQNMNKDIIAYTRRLALSLTQQQAMCLYPALYFGMRILRINDCPATVRLAVTVNI